MLLTLYHINNMNLSWIHKETVVQAISSILLVVSIFQIHVHVHLCNSQK